MSKLFAKMLEVRIFTEKMVDAVFRQNCINLIMALFEVGFVIFITSMTSVPYKEGLIKIL